MCDLMVTLFIELLVIVVEVRLIVDLFGISAFTRVEVLGHAAAPCEEEPRRRARKRGGGLYR